MKTTVEISDPLLRDARRLAAREGTTLRALIEQGLRRILSDKKKPKAPFKLRDASFKGRGLHPDMQGATWEQIRDKIYEGRGG
jgi:hypothetical protein